MNSNRSVLIFEQYIQSEKTRENYRCQINAFCKWANYENWDKLLATDSQELRIKIEDYVIYLKNKPVSPNYIRAKTFAIQSLCDSNEKEGINWKKIRRLLGKKIKPKKTRPYTTNEVKLLLGTVRELRSKALILFLSSSGVRRGAIPDMKIKDLKQMPDGCVMVTVYADTNEEYITFINKEASDALTRYHKQREYDGERLTPDSLVFRAKYRSSNKKSVDNVRKFGENSITNVIERAKQNSGIAIEDVPNMLCHAFRRRFNTILKLQNNANPTLIERLMGHDQGLDNSYFQPTPEQLFEEYQKGMSDLSIDDSERLLAERKLIEEQMTELEAQKAETVALKRETETLKSDYERLIALLTSQKAEIKEQRGSEFHLRLKD